MGLQGESGEGTLGLTSLTPKPGHSPVPPLPPGVAFKKYCVKQEEQGVCIVYVRTTSGHMSRAWPQVVWFETGREYFFLFLKVEAPQHLWARNGRGLLGVQMVPFLS